MAGNLNEQRAPPQPPNPYDQQQVPTQPPGSDPFSGGGGNFPPMASLTGNTQQDPYAQAG
jgi:hypothetical protein